MPVGRNATYLCSASVSRRVSGRSQGLFHADRHQHRLERTGPALGRIVAKPGRSAGETGRYGGIESIGTRRGRSGGNGTGPRTEPEPGSGAEDRRIVYASEPGSI